MYVQSCGSCQTDDETIIVDEHVAGVGAENDVNIGTAADNERVKRHVTDVNSDVLMSYRTVKHST